MGGFCVWGTDHQLNDADLDPNYLLEGKEAQSPFHRALHAWVGANVGTPLMHVDIHGKFDRKDNYDLDLGVRCLYTHWCDEEMASFVLPMVEHLTAGFNRVLAPIPNHKKVYKAKCNNDPVLHGYWGGSLKTMTEQACQIGIPSI